MRLETVHREVANGGMMEVASATIKATAKIFDMFANDTYANKPLAIIRETVANGIDAHKAAGRGDRPVELILPTTLDPTCRIRDYGTGMAHDFVMGPFMAYTDGSTKDKDDGAIGGFGIGSKSPLSYVDQFNLRVVHKGVLSVYTLFKGEDGIPMIGLQGQTTTDEHDGVEISFPVEDDDIQTFRDAAQEACQYFLPMPLVTNGTLNPPDYTYIGTDWAMRPAAGELGIIMGGVRYPAAKASMTYELRSSPRLAPLLDYGLDLTLPIGACGVAMSREQLSYIPKTSESIKNALNAVIDDVIATFSTFFDDCPSKWDAMIKLGKETGFDTYNRSGRAQLLMAEARYQGNKLETSFRLDDPDIKAWSIPPKQSRKRSVNIPSAKWVGLSDLYSITPARIETLIIDDLPVSPKSKSIARIREFVEGQDQLSETIVLRTDTVKRLLLLLGSPSDYVLTSSLPEPAVTTKVKSQRPRVRMFTFDGGADRFTNAPIRNLTPALSKKGIVNEIAYPDQPATGIMVVMDSFDLPPNFYEKMNTQLVGYRELYFVNKADQPKLKDTFKNFDDIFQARLDDALAAIPDLPERIALSRAMPSGYPAMFRRIHGDRRYQDLPNAAYKRPFGQLYAAWDKYVRPLDSDQLKLSPFVVAKLPQGIDPDVLVKKISTETKILVSVLDMDDFNHRGLLFKNL